MLDSQLSKYERSFSSMEKKWEKGIDHCQNWISEG